MVKRILYAALILSAVLALTVLLALLALAQDDEQSVLDGKALYYKAWGNSSYSCIYCHANFDEAKLDDGYLRPGHPLWSSVIRPSYYNGAYTGQGDIPLARAINTCASGFLKVKPLGLSDSRMLHLIAYLRAISPDTEALAVTVTRATELPPLDGDPRRGEMLYKAACILCHREKSSAPVLTFKAQSDLVAAKIRGLKTSAEAIHEIAEWPAPMPFFSMERMSDQQVADIVAYWEYTQFLMEEEHKSVPAIEPEAPAEPTEGVNPEAPPEEAPPARPPDEPEG
jgi:mono/diheme cytochrome c family protein